MKEIKDSIKIIGLVLALGLLTMVVSVFISYMLSIFGVI